jgi:hypothetical protein
MVAAIISLIGVLTTAIIGFLTWSRSLQFQILKEERQRFESKSKLLLDNFSDVLYNKEIDPRLIAMIRYEFPKNVRDEFEKILNDGVFETTDDSVKKKAYIGLVIEISKAINDYDTKIIKTAKGVNTEFAIKQLEETLKMINPLKK